jgi:membrane-bound ClpP family serine protease
MKSAVVCRDVQPLLSAYVDHEASPTEALQVEEHVQACAECQARLQRMRRLAPRLDQHVQAHVSEGERAAASLNRSYRPPPQTMLAEPSMPFVARFATVAVLLVFAALTAFVLLRSAPGPRALQTGAQPAPTPSAAQPEGPVIGISIDGLVDAPTAAYVQRAVDEAEQQHASVLVWDAPSGGLTQSVEDVERTLANSSVPTYAYAPSPQNPTATGLAEATTTRVDSIPKDASIDWKQMNLGEAVWHRVLDPTTAYLFFVLGLYAVFLELAHPGTLVPGITGLVAMGIAAVAFSSLPTNWLGVAAVVGGVALMVLELKTSKHGLLLGGGVVCLAAGSLVLYASPGLLSPLVLIGVVLLGVVLGFVLVRVAQGVRRLPAINPLQELVGARGVARTTLSPDGVVQVNGQTWSAHVRGAPVQPGEPVRVVARRGLVLDVTSASFHAAATQKGARW